MATSAPNYSKKYHVQTLIAAVVAAIAATISAYLSVAPWIMFIGWVVYFTKSGSLSNTLTSTVCACLGILIGMAAANSIGVLAPSLGVVAFAVVVFVVASIVITLRGISVINNIPAWFLGMITYFAAHPEPSVLSILSLILTVVFGVFAGYFAHQMQIKVG
ncbi:MAG: DUF1097 domain-containing protein [Paraglaciecola sp.]|uniref:DUF1097 domain-containing protein n=1 Tax=Paraglaciecola sp. TaxID=1920173 RepID=UPI003299763D